jgi:two-component system sensor histidine kinase SenX3
VTVVVAAIAGLLVGLALATLGWRAARHRSGAPTPAGLWRRRTVGDAPSSAEMVLRLLPMAAAVVDAADLIQLANPAAARLGIVGGTELTIEELAELVRTARRTGESQMAELSLDVGRFPHRLVMLRGRADPLDSGEVALIVDDITEARQLDAVRRDFVANAGHEIKTPVGALTLLAEAALDANDDPVAVRRFVGRMQHEAQRLGRLVQELIDLSRLQGAEPLPPGTRVTVGDVIDEAVDRTRLAAEAKRISIVRSGVAGVVVLGDEGQLVTAVSNLLDNAVAYSPNDTHVAVAVHLDDDAVEITVTDDGIGITKDDQQRIFERFYRVDQARSRATGGTGLGLAIVKHIVGNHGGSVEVWSRPGSGSTFTIRLTVLPTAQEVPTP